MSSKKQKGSDKKSNSESEKKSKVESEKKPKNEKTKGVKDTKNEKDGKDGKDGKGKKNKFQGLDKVDIKLLRSYTKDRYTEQIKATKTDVDNIFKNVNKLAGIKPSDTGLSRPSMWDFQADKDMMKQEEPLKVVRVLQIIPPATKEDGPRYIIQAKHGNKYVTELDKELSPVDIKEGMRVGVDKQYKIKLPLPLKISKAVKLMEVEEKPDVTYADIGGCKEQVKKLREVIEMSLTQQKKFSFLGVEPPRGALMTGPPGMGKTLCARAVANRSDACYIRVIGSELAQRYIGEGAQLVRDIFEYARTKSACIIFFDEIDAIGQTRTQGGEHGDNEAGRTLMELIIQLDGFDPRGNIKVLMATNRGDTLDPALLRPGRLDRKIEFGTPDYQGRIEIFKIHTRHMSVARGIRYELLARLCNLASGADIRSICTEAGMYAIRERKKMATEREFLRAIDKVMHRDKKFSALGRYMTHN